MTSRRRERRRETVLLFTIVFLRFTLSLQLAMDGSIVRERPEGVAPRPDRHSISRRSPEYDRAGSSNAYRAISPDACSPAPASAAPPHGGKAGIARAGRGPESCDEYLSASLAVY